MAKKDMRAALKGSLQQEEQATQDRFAKAETVLRATNKGNSSPPNPQPVTKVIRDSFTMPSSDYDLIPVLKKRSMKAGIGVSKSEIIRAGLLALSGMTEREFIEAVEKVEKVKTGRPKQTV